MPDIRFGYSLAACTHIVVKPKVVELPDNASRPAASPVGASRPAAKLHRIIVTPEVPTEAPSSAFEFEKHWHTLQGHPDLFATYLKVTHYLLRPTTDFSFQIIPPTSLKDLFRLSLTPEIFNSILIALSEHYMYYIRQYCR